MTPQRRKGDQQRRSDDGAMFLVKYWPIISCLAAVILSGIIAFVHLEDDNKAIRAQQDAIRGRLDFHWGKEW